MRRFVLASLVLVACYSTDNNDGSDDDGESGAGGTTASTGGSAGSGGANAGTAGSAGSSDGEGGAGSGGSSGVSSGGTSGGTGEAGAGNAGEASTTGGTAGAGAAGSSGTSGGAGEGEGGSAGTTIAGTGGGGGAAGGNGEAPTVAVLLDGSSSMFEPRELLWDALHSALMDPASGVIPTFEQELRLGFSVFRGSTTVHEETDPACASITSVDYALGNAAAIGTTYDLLTGDYMVDVKWETPTAHALNRVASALAAEAVPDGSEKYIVLITDGNPNTCLTLDPQCGQDLVVKAVQDAYTLGIRTLVFGLGDVLTPNAGCDPSLMPCGPVHLQDVANAGLGLPVAAPPANYYLTSCVVGGTLVASYATAGGSATFYTGTTVDDMRTAISSIMERIASGAVP